MPDTVLPAGPFFGPDSVVIDAGDEQTSGIGIYPDAHNTQLRAADQPTRYYFQPARISLAQRHGSADLDFSMTALVQHAAGGLPLSYIGGSCTFASTFALPDAVNTGIVHKLMIHDHPDPPARIRALFNYWRGDPVLSLRMVPVTRSAVSCVVGHPGTAPIFMNVQHSTTGSIELQGNNTFLVSCTPAAAEEVVTDLRDGAAPPFVVRNVLTEQFDTGSTTLIADLEVDVDELYEAFSEVMPSGGPPAGAGTADVVYQTGISVGAIRADFTEATGGRADSRLKAWMNNTDVIKKTVFDMVKEQLFDLSPNESTEQSRSGPTWWGDVFGDSKVSLKNDIARTGMSQRRTVTLHGALSVERTVEGNLNELITVDKSELDKYLTVVDVGGF
jgi:hypothetical protein